MVHAAVMVLAVIVLAAVLVLVVAAVSMMTCRVSGGSRHAAGDVWTSGCNYNGQLGLTDDHGWEDPTPPPSPLPELKGVLEVRIMAARNLPKMDAIGTCDAFCELWFQVPLRAL